MADWLKNLVGEGNVARDRVYTNWNSVETTSPTIVQKSEKTSDQSPEVKHEKHKDQGSSDSK